MSATYEEIARRLEDGDPRELSDVALALEYGVEERFVARVRREGGHARYTHRHVTLRERAEAKVREHSVLVDGGHCEWDGPRSKDGVPLVSVRGLTTTVARVAFQTATGRTPVGNVKALCPVPHCVAPRCQTDRPMREGLRAPLPGEAAVT